MRSELERLNRAAVKFATDRSGDVQSLAERCRFLFAIYKHHCNAEDEVVVHFLSLLGEILRFFRACLVIIVVVRVVMNPLSFLTISYWFCGF